MGNYRMQLFYDLGGAELCDCVVTSEMSSDEDVMLLSAAA